jgi:hypothetical protein
MQIHTIYVDLPNEVPISVNDFSDRGFTMHSNGTG